MPVAEIVGLSEGAGAASRSNQAPAQETVSSPFPSEQLHEAPNPPAKVQSMEGELTGGHTQAQVGFLAQAAGRVMHERDVPDPDTPPAKL